MVHVVPQPAGVVMSLPGSVIEVRQVADAARHQEEAQSRGQDRLRQRVQPKRQ